MRVSVIHPSTRIGDAQELAAAARAHAPEGMAIRALGAPFGAQLISTPSTLRLAHEAIGTMADTLIHDDGVIVGSAFDPGIERLRAVLPGKVVGAGEAAMRTAARRGPFSIVTTAPKLGEALRALAKAYGLAPHLASVRAFETETPFTAGPGDAARFFASVHTAFKDDGARSVIVDWRAFRADMADGLGAEIALIDPLASAVAAMEAALGEVL
ncbi:aspartate/glutamate racemase family protein [Acuticoccus kandeliae]|uniref:aspartate/glutamate racemase family protein n=1 Tax=Acuticoccus kandeliae TaxID=2073160 RepID=UPI000D3E429E|nr:aspartate/glutamate racemase family protein [Acuticoccus kandeliae]